MRANADGTRSLLFVGVLEDGAMAACNKHCVSGLNAGRHIQAGDRIVGVNGTSVTAEMLKECRERRLRKFMVVRGTS